MFSNDETKDREESFLLKNKSPASPKTSEVSNRCSNSGRRNIFFSWEGLIWFIQVQYNDARNCRCRMSANDVMRRSDAPRPYHAPILCHCDIFVTNFTAA
ncbi:hypothetical protein EVAR_79325_1 [Eumeta japonica]|uniref:Uncharacterized protein n=1 Tax=Eumeta variegata TaxID=151549 RepID=A0A4C1THE5_EUMVA|nr:hypothetical protein EVAR_79325_1 [Eumeta japonica]